MYHFFKHSYKGQLVCKFGTNELMFFAIFLFVLILIFKYTLMIIIENSTLFSIYLYFTRMLYLSRMIPASIGGNLDLIYYKIIILI